MFLFLEPKAGKRHTLVTARRTKEDGAKAMRYLVDDLYPEANQIDLVLDNLNTHSYKVLIELFGKAEADRIMGRLVFHYTPLHGRWLNLAEIELSVMARQCTNRRLGDAFTLADCAAAPALFYADWVHPIGDAFRNVAAYRARLLARPSVRRAVDDARPFRTLFPGGAPDRD